MFPFGCRHNAARKLPGAQGMLQSTNYTYFRVDGLLCALDPIAEIPKSELGSGRLRVTTGSITIWQSGCGSTSLAGH